MSAMPDLRADFVLAEGVPLDADDLGYGFERGFLKATAVIDVAAAAVGGGNDDPVMQELAALLRDDVGRVPEVLRALDDPERIHDPRESARKWLYLQLKAAYTGRERHNDPLGVVEAIYANFDYPPAVASLVRYMPLQVGDEPGDAALMKRWAEFLDREHDALRHGDDE
jgi:hypothetical protein